MQRTNGALPAGGPWRDGDRRSSPVDLQRVACGQAPLGDALQILTHRHEEQAWLEADLRKREAWVVAALLDRSEAVWHLLPEPTLHFMLDPAPLSEPCHLEVGRYAHLAALVDPSEGEQELISSTTLCWARVRPYHRRQCAGQDPALARSYEPIQGAEAVPLLGLGVIMTALESAMRQVGSDLRAQAERQNRREGQVAYLERMLGWDASGMDGPAGRAATIRARLALSLLGQGQRRGRLLGTVLLVALVALVCLLVQPLLAFFAFPPLIAGLLLWEHLRPS